VVNLATISGLASGIQWRDLVDQIIRAESRPIELLRSRISEIEARTKAWSDFSAKVTALRDAARALAAGSGFEAFQATVSGVPAGAQAPLSVTAGAGAAPGLYRVRVLSLAANEKLGSAVFASRTEALGLDGEFLVNGVVVRVKPTDSLDAIARAINAANGGSSASGVTASVLSVGSGAYRLVLTSDRSGAAGIDLVDGASGVLRSLGFLDPTTTLKHATSNGARSDGFASSTIAVGALLGLTAAPAGDVTFGAPGQGFTVTLDLATMSLEQIAGAISAAAAAAGSAVRATVVEETIGRSVVHRLSISGTTSFADANRVLEVLGVLQAGRDAVAQRLESGNALTDGATGSAATGATRLVDLWIGGSPAQVRVGDTLTITGTRGDGSTFSKTFTVQADSTLDDLLAALNSATDGLKAGGRTATASLSADGRIVVADDAGGDSRLALSIVANNEGGGTLDFGAFSTVELGRARQLAAGADAVIEIDGTRVTRSSNTLTDVIPGLTLTLLSAEPGMAVDVAVTRDTAAMVSAIETFVGAYNSLVDFVKDQLTPPPSGGSSKPLASDATLRGIHGHLFQAMETRLAAGIAGTFTRLADIGITIGRDARYVVDKNALTAAVESNPVAVQRLLGLSVEATGALLTSATAGDRTRPGTYAVTITQAATRATVTGGAGPYVDDALPDLLRIRDIGSGWTYTISLAAGMTVADIRDALNAEFATRQRQKLQSGAAFRDVAGNPAGDDVTWANLRNADGTSPGVANGDVITFSGTRSNGEAFFGTYVITDVTTQTLGELRAAIQEKIGADVVVSFVDGVLTVEAKEAGASRLSLTVSSNNAGGGTLSFGGFAVVTEGRGVAPIRASVVDGRLVLEHESYGSAYGFEVSFEPQGADGTVSLGIAAGTYRGQDVQGTIGGLPAEGRGQRLAGAAGTEIEGLAVLYTGTATGTVGSITVGRGTASAVWLAAEELLGSGTGSIASLRDGLQGTIDQLRDRENALTDRLERRREELVRRFTAMELALARAQTQAQWLSAQLAQFGGLL
jgi:flagellar hook-associated protein 2